MFFVKFRVGLVDGPVQSFALASLQDIGWLGNTVERCAALSIRLTRSPISFSGISLFLVLESKCGIQPCQSLLQRCRFCLMVMELVDKGVLSLDKPVYQYLPKPLPDYPNYKDLAGDQRYKLITSRLLLSHTSGFAKFTAIIS